MFCCCDAGGEQLVLEYVSTANAKENQMSVPEILFAFTYSTEEGRHMDANIHEATFSSWICAAAEEAMRARAATAAEN